MFLKFRHNWAHSKGDWEYKLLSFSDDPWTEEELEAEVAEMTTEHEWSDKYRGIDYETILTPPREWLVVKRDRCSKRILSLIKTREKFNKLLKEAV